MHKLRVQILCASAIRCFVAIFIRSLKTYKYIIRLLLIGECQPFDSNALYLFGLRLIKCSLFIIGCQSDCLFHISRLYKRLVLNIVEGWDDLFVFFFPSDLGIRYSQSPIPLAVIRLFLNKSFKSFYCLVKFLILKRLPGVSYLHRMNVIR